MGMVVQVADGRVVGLWPVEDVDSAIRAGEWFDGEWLVRGFTATEMVTGRVVTVEPGGDLLAAITG